MKKMPYKIQTYRVRFVRDRSVGVYSKSLLNVEHAREFFRPVLDHLPHEEVWLALLNAGSDVTGLVRVAMGGVAACAIRPADILRPVLVSGCAAFVLAHNHPSGDPTPSPADLKMTAEIKRLSEAMGAPLVDHVIIGLGGAWRSCMYSNETEVIQHGD